MKRKSKRVTRRKRVRGKKNGVWKIFSFFVFAFLAVISLAVYQLVINTSYRSLQIASNEPRQNLQLETFYITPTPVTTSCVADSGLLAGSNCKCPDVYWDCKGGKCIDVNQDKSGMKGYTCDSPWGRTACNFPPGDGPRCYGKPVIYLYPTAPTLVNVSVTTAGSIVVSNPQYPQNGWKNVLAEPNGNLTYQGKQYSELFYETSVNTVSKPQVGIVIATKDLELKLRSFIQKLGLTKPNEQQEFLDWWLPKLTALHAPYIFVSLVSKNEKRRFDAVEISPKPDTFIDFIVYFKPMDKIETVAPLVLPPAPQRVGFTAIEWGGVIDP